MTVLLNPTENGTRHARALTVKDFFFTYLIDLFKATPHVLIQEIGRYLIYSPNAFFRIA